MSEIPSRPVGEPDSVSQEWWDATREGRLVVQRCNACNRYQHYPRALCAACSSTDLQYVEASGRGVVHSFTVVNRPPHKAFSPPYVAALVEIDEGVRMVTNVVGCEPDSVRCDMRVRVTWEPLPDGRRLPLFEPEAS